MKINKYNKILRIVYHINERNISNKKIRKMSIFTKVLSISNKRDKLVEDSFGVGYLYPNDTTRIVRKLTWKGYKEIRENCRISISSDSDGQGVVYYNQWTQIEHTPAYIRQQKLKRILNGI